MLLVLSFVNLMSCMQIKIVKKKGQSEVVEEIWCETCLNFSSDRSSLVGDLIQIVRSLRLQNHHLYFPNESCFDQ